MKSGSPADSQDWGRLRQRGDNPRHLQQDMLRGQLGGRKDDSPLKVVPKPKHSLKV